MATQISTNVELVLFNNVTRPGTILLPSTTTIPGRILTFKNTTGALGTSTITFSTIAGQTFEGGATRQIYNDPFGVYSFMAGQDNRWYTIGGVRMNTANISTIQATNFNVQNIISSANIVTSTIQIEDSVTPSVNTVFLTSSILYYQAQGQTQAQNELFVFGGTQAPKQQLIPTVFSFDPRLIPNLVLWLDANDPTSFSFSSGTNIRVWFDKSGRAFHFSQDTLANQPTYSSSGFTNRGSVVFNATTTVLSSTSPLASLFGGTDTPITIFVVVRFIDHTNPQVQAVFNIYTGTGTNGWHAIYVDNVSAPNKWRNGRRDITSASIYVNSLNDIIAGSNYIYTHIFQRTVFNGFINGVQDANMTNAYMDLGDLTYTTSVASLGAQIRTSTQYYLNGEIGEILVYNGQVLGNQQLQVQQYLSNKWNIPVAPPFTPTFVPGLAFWLDASQLTGLTNGQTISTWNDLSPNAFPGTAVGSPTYTTNSQNGLPGITFNGTTQYINFGNILNLGTTLPIFIFAACRFTNTGSGAIVVKSSYRGNVGRWGLYRDLGNLTMMVDLTGFGYNTTFADTNSTDTRIFTGYWDRNTVFAMSNGFPTAFNPATYATNMTNTDPLWVGAYPNGSGTAPPQYFFQGVIYEILIYTSNINYSQRINIENYLAAKWGVTLNRFSPQSIPGLRLWFDAGDTASMFFSPGTSNVTQWNDKSGSSPPNNTTLTSGTITYSQTGLSTRGTLSFNNSFFTGPVGTAYTGGNIYSFGVFSINASSVNYTRILALGQPGVNDFNSAATCIPFVRDTGLNQIYVVANNAGAPRHTIGYDSLFLSQSFYTGNTMNINVNGSNRFNTATATNAFNITSYGIGTNTNTNGADPYVGQMGEMLSYFGSLTLAQRLQVEGYLAWRWGITLQSSVSPLDIITPQLWLDGADQGTLYSDSAGTTAASVGQTIGYWRDKSGQGRHYTQATVGNRPSYSSSSNIVFNSSAGLSNAATWNPTTSWDIFFVGRPLTPAGSTNWRTLLRGLNTDHPILVENAATRIGYYNNGVGAFYPFGSLTVDGNSTVLGYVSISATRTYSAALNGTLSLSAATPAGSSDVNMFYSLGNWNPNGGNQPWGTLNEIVIVPNTNTVQRQTMEGYLAWKWGLQGSLPLDHPYKNTAPLHPFRNTPP